MASAWAVDRGHRVRPLGRRPQWCQLHRVRPETPQPVIDVPPSQADKLGTGGTMRLGLPMRVKDGSWLALYGTDGAGLVFERHRHR